jgi:Flp pilus assembly protein TadD
MTDQELYKLGLSLGKDNQLDEAFAALERCVELNPEHALACKELARLSLSANELRAFTNWLHEAQRIDNADPEPHRMMASVLTRMGRHEEAAEELALADKKEAAAD